MSNSGKDLEALVRSIETRLFPDSFTVEERRRLYNDAGTQVAEFDIYISGSLGSSSVHWLIECRDRPSAGPAPRAWIEQLLGRRLAYDAEIDKVFAVSTTGFSEGAVELAGRHGIVLRTVSDMRDIASDFTVDHLTYHAYTIAILGTVNFVAANGRWMNVPHARGLRLKAAGEARYQTIGHFIGARLLNDVDDSDDVQRLVFQHLTGTDVIVGGQSVRAVAVTVPIEVRWTHYTAATLAVRVYAEGDRMIAYDGRFELPLPAGPAVFTVTIVPRPDGSHNTVFTQMGGEPMMDSGTGTNLYDGLTTTYTPDPS